MAFGTPAPILGTLSERTERQKVHKDLMTVAAELVMPSVGQKAPSAKRCIKTGKIDQRLDALEASSESTERQKVH